MLTIQVQFSGNEIFLGNGRWREEGNSSLKKHQKNTQKNKLKTLSFQKVSGKLRCIWCGPASEKGGRLHVDLHFT